MLSTALWTSRKLTVRVRHDDQWEEYALDQPFAIVGSHSRCHVRLPSGKPNLSGTPSEAPSKSFLIHASDFGVYVQPLHRHSIDGQWVEQNRPFNAHHCELVVSLDGDPTPQCWPEDGMRRVEFFHHDRGKGELESASPLCIIGRRRPSHWRMEHDRVSACHCALYFQDSRTWIIDLLSRGGMRVENEFVKVAEISLGQRVKLDDHIAFELVTVDSQAAVRNVVSTNDGNKSSLHEQAVESLEATERSKQVEQVWGLLAEQEDPLSESSPSAGADPSEIDATLQRLAQDLAHSESAAESVERECEELRRREAALRSELEDACSRAAELQSEIEAARQWNAADRASHEQDPNSEPREALQTSDPPPSWQVQHGELQAECEQLRERVETLQRDLDETKGREMELASETESARKQSSSLEKQLAAWEQQCKDLQTRCEHWQSLAESQAQSLANQDARADAAEQSLLEARRELDETLSQLRTTKVSLSDAESVQQKTQHQLKESESRCDNAQRQLLEARSDWEKAQEQIREVNAEAVNFKQRAEESHAEAESNRTALAQSQQALSAAEAELAKLHAISQQQSSESSQLRDDLAAVRQDASNQTLRLAELSSEIERLTAALNAAEVGRKSADDTLATYQDELESLSKQQDEWSEARDRWSKEQEAWNVEQSRLIAEIESSNLERDSLLAEHSETAAVMESERDALASELDALGAERDALVEKRDALAAERDALVAERDDARSRAESRDTIVTKLEERVVGLEAELGAATQWAGELELAQDATLQELESLQTSMEQAHEQNRELDEAAQRVASERDTWKHRAEQADSQLAALERSADDATKLSATLRQREDEIADLETQLTVTQTQLQESEQICNQLQQDRDQLQAAINDGNDAAEQSENQLHSRKIEGLRDELNAARVEITIAQQRCETLVTEQAQLNATIKQLILERDAACQECESLKHSRDTSNANADTGELGSGVSPPPVPSVPDFTFAPTGVLQHELESAQMLADVLTAANEELRIEQVNLQAKINELELIVGTASEAHARELKERDIELQEAKQHLELFRADWDFTLERKEAELAKIRNELQQANEQLAAIQSQQPPAPTEVDSPTPIDSRDVPEPLRQFEAALESMSNRPTTADEHSVDRPTTAEERTNQPAHTSADDSTKQTSTDVSKHDADVGPDPPHDEAKQGEPLQTENPLGPDEQAADAQEGEESSTKEAPSTSSVEEESNPKNERWPFWRAGLMLLTAAMIVGLLLLSYVLE